MRADLGPQRVETDQCFVDVLSLPAAEAKQVDDASGLGLDFELAEPTLQDAEQSGQ